jgi:hypothetical protein
VLSRAGIGFMCPTLAKSRLPAHSAVPEANSTATPDPTSAATSTWC